MVLFLALKQRLHKLIVCSDIQVSEEAEHLLTRLYIYEDDSLYFGHSDVRREKFADRVYGPEVRALEARVNRQTA